MGLIKTKSARVIKTGRKNAKLGGKGEEEELGQKKKTKRMKTCFLHELRELNN